MKRHHYSGESTRGILNIVTDFILLLSIIGIYFLKGVAF